MREPVEDFRVRAADDPASLLIIILDTSIHSWIQPKAKNPVEAVEEAVVSIQSVTEQVLVFINTFLLLHEFNRVVVIVSSSNMTKVVYPVLPPADALPSSYEPQSEDDWLSGAAHQLGQRNSLSDLDATARQLREHVVNGVKHSIQMQERQNNMNRPLTITNALATALCLFNRARRIKASRAAINMSDGQSRGTRADQGNLSNGRILHFLASQDDPQQYVPIMNCIFSAQRIGVLIDTCVLTNRDSTYFQQAAHLTKGVYLKPDGLSTNTPNSLIQILHSIFLVDKQSRDFLAMLTPEKVDFRASCLQTKKIIDSGYTCSVCLSTFDMSVGKQGLAICPICNARYTPSSQIRQPRRR